MLTKASPARSRIATIPSAIRTVSLRAFELPHGWSAAPETYVYIREEYPELRLMLADEIAKIENAGLMPHTKLHLRRGAGAQIRGEESAMIESIRASAGCLASPALCRADRPCPGVRRSSKTSRRCLDSRHHRERRRVGDIAGPARTQGLPQLFGVGPREESGVKLAPAGITMRELIDEFCGGMQDGHVFKGYLPGGPSGGILPASMADIPLDFGTLEKYGCFVGSHAVVILSDKDDIKAAALNLMQFFEDESCGQCTPCRVGTEKAAKLMAKGPWDVKLLEELSSAMRDASICGLGQAAPNPLLCVIKYFAEELEKPLGHW